MLQLAKVFAYATLSLLVLSTAVTAETNASLDEPSVTKIPVSTGSGTITLPQNKMTTSGNYSVSLPIAAKGWEAAEDGSAGDALEQVLPIGTQLSVLDWTEDADRGELVRLGVEHPEGRSDLAPDIYVSLTDFSSFTLEEVETLSPIEAHQITRAEDDSYLGYIAILLAAASGRSSSSRRSRGMTYCYRNVKNHLLSEGLVDTYLPGGSAYMAIQELPKNGFRRLRVRHPDRAPNGSICVYDRDSRNRHGHIEVKKSKDCYWYGYGCKAQSMYESREFYDCFAKGSARPNFFAFLSSGNNKSNKKKNSSQAR